MTKTISALLSILFAGLTISAQAATINFTPDTVQFQVLPGETASAAISVSATSGTPYALFINAGSQVEGNLPTGWLTPATLMFSSRTGGTTTTTMNLLVTIPADTPGGSYTGRIMPKDMGGREPIASAGLDVTINVESLRTCTSPPVFDNIEITPRDAWAPTDRDVEIDISGKVSVQPGCSFTATYGLESNTGMVGGELLLGGDNSFNQTISATLSRSGTDKEGKSYQGILTAVDSEGNEAVHKFSVTVDHDRGKKEAKKK